MNKQLQINKTEQLIINTKSVLKIWANQISQYHKALKELTKQLETIKQQITMNENIKQNENNKLNNWHKVILTLLILIMSEFFAPHNTLIDDEKITTFNARNVIKNTLEKDGFIAGKKTMVKNFVKIMIKHVF